MQRVVSPDVEFPTVFMAL